MQPLADAYLQATQRTAQDLKTMATSLQVLQLSHLSLPEVEHLAEEIARVVPAGNVPGLILSGLVRLGSRQISSDVHHQNVALLFRGVRDLLDKAVYTTLFAGPAAILMAYQNLLKLAGKELDSAFPDGTWQFYLEFALREDSARHANETTGFQSSLAFHNLSLTDADRLTAWVMASLVTLHSYPALLENEWRERVTISLLKRFAAMASDTAADTMNLACSEWESLRPYTRSHDAGSNGYAAFRQHRFADVVANMVKALPRPMHSAFQSALREAEQHELVPFLRQMSILARLTPDTYREQRIPYDLYDSSIAIIHHGNYFLIPAGISAEAALPNVHTVRSVVAEILQKPRSVAASNLDLLLVTAKRAAQPDLRAKLDRATQQGIKALGCVPIILNWDHALSSQPLAAVRQGRRGLGDHALTLFFTDESTIFDQSHIFFDGAWGAALSEIMTNEALSWALYLRQLPPPAALQSKPQQLTLNAPQQLKALAARERISIEAFAESDAIRLSPVQTLRRVFKARNDLVNVTVNDLLVLYRSIHGQRYQPSVALQKALTELESDPSLHSVWSAAAEAIKKTQQTNPALLIPMDASQSAPKERVYPTTFRNPLTDLLAHHDTTYAALNAYQIAGGDRAAVYEAFDEHQRTYLRMIASFGVLMRRYREIAVSGQSTSTTSIKMLAYMPDAVQHLLNQIPNRFDVLNEVIKGEEVFSNIGRVPRGSSVRRFITAKDDNEQKTLAWGFLTDDRDILHVSLRDFRPHVALLWEHGLFSLALRMTQDFLDNYTQGFNQFIRELREITVASRETKAARLPLDPA